MKPEVLEKAIKLNNKIRNLQRKLGVVQQALDKGDWGQLPLPEGRGLEGDF